MNKTIYRIISIIMAFTLTFEGYYSAQAANIQAFDAQSIPQTIIYSNPSNLSISEIGNRFQTAIMSRGKGTEFFAGYTSVGIRNFYIYLNADRMEGPSGLASTNAQTTHCTAAQKEFIGYTNNVMMDKGDFCKILDAIISHTCLTQYPDICPTESFFLHKPDGSRYLNSEGLYRPNPADPLWRKYFTYRALRELSSTDPTHPPLSGVTGIYLDNLDASFNQLMAESGGLPPKEFANGTLYDVAMVGFTHSIKQAIGNYKLIGNMNDLTSSWDAFANDLDGALAESWSTNWNTTISSTASLSLILQRAEAWIARGKTIYLVTQGDSAGTNNLFGLSMFMLVYQPGSEYRYMDPASSANYHEIPEYFLQMGQPLGARVKLSDSPLVYQRCFQSGSVTVNLTAKTASYGSACSTTTTSIPASPTMTFTSVASLTSLPFTATQMLTATKVPTATNTTAPTVTLQPSSTPVSPVVMIDNSENSVDARIARGNDDVEENSSGKMYMDSSDLELIYDQNTQVVGLRFTDIKIPKGATITNAYIQFKVDETSNKDIRLTIKGEATANASVFSNTNQNVSKRPVTSNSVAWLPAPWLKAGQMGKSQQTPNLKSIVQEITSQTNWNSGNSLVLIITGHKGKRVAKSYEGDASGAPLLHIEFSMPTQMAAVASPTAIFTPTATLAMLMISSTDMPTSTEVAISSSPTLEVIFPTGTPVPIDTATPTDTAVPTVEILPPTDTPVPTVEVVIPTDIPAQ